MRRKRHGYPALLAGLVLAAALAGARSHAAQGEEAAAPDPLREEIQAFLAKARELIADRKFDASETAHYVVRTDDPRLLVAETAKLLEAFRGHFDSFFSGRLDLREWEEPTQVFLFYSRYKYRQLLSGRAADVEAPFVGHYMPMVGVIAAHTDSVGPGNLPGLLIHETAHQLVHRRLYGDAIQPSTWINEGLAQYFEYTRRDKSGRFLAGQVGPTGAVLVKGESGGGRWAGDEEFKLFRKQVRQAEPGFLDELIRLWSPGQFYGEGYPERYTASWILVHYLLHADGGAHGAGFLRYVRREASGEGGPDVFYEAIGMTPEELEARFLEHVKRKMKVD